MKARIVGPFLFVNAALVGFFVFAAIYHLIFWWSSRRETVLAFFSADCAVRAGFSSVLILITTATTTAQAQSALHLRVTLGIILMVTWVWSLSLISGVSAPRFVWFVTALCVVLFPIHVFLTPLNATVLSMETIILPWGETITRPRMGYPGWWIGPLYALVMSIELFGIYCGLRVWNKDRVTGALIVLATTGLLFLHVAHSLRVYGIAEVPYIGMLGHAFWAGMIGLVIARRNYQMVEELRSSRRRLEALSRQLITTQESERRHLARELHDEIGQVLTAIKMNLRGTQRLADMNLQRHLDENVAMVDQAIGQVRNLSLSLRPQHLDELGLVAALHWLIKHQARLGGFDEQLDVELGNARLSADLETVCFRIAQEALTNAVRHGKPSKVNVKLLVQDGELFLSIQDNGIGFDVEGSGLRALQGDCFGLAGMKERASLAGGQIAIESAPDQGTRVHGRFPLFST